MDGPKIGVIRDRGVLGIEALGGNIEQAKPLARDPSYHLGRDTSPRPLLTHAEQPSGAGNGGEHRVHVQRLDRAEIDDFDLVAIPGQIVGGGYGLVEHRAVRDDRGVAARAG